jgi:Uma2 family endonuclease
MAATTHLITVEEFRKLPPDEGPIFHELRHGELVPVTRPKLKHSLIQRSLRRLIEQLAEPGSLVGVEVAFRPLPEYELWAADVAHVSRERFQQADPEDNICGSPEIVVEVLSPSHTAAEIYDREQVCLANGAREFWVVDPDVALRQKIPLPLGGDAQVAVDAIFA